MSIRNLRLQRGWSQEQLSELCGLSIRTIQRIERGQNPSLESLKSLAAVFEVDMKELGSSVPDSESVCTNAQEQLVMNQVQEIRGFYGHLITYIIVIALLFLINFVTHPNYIWAIWPALGWGIGILKHALRAFRLFYWFNDKWEKKQLEKRLRRKL